MAQAALGGPDVWTGEEMIIWGGYSSSNFNDGARYNPTADRWGAVAAAGAPVARRNHTAVWTGTEMIVWGGIKETPLNTGARYSPAGNSWTALTTFPAPTHATGIRQFGRGVT